MVNPTLYLLFLGIAVPTVLTPGPGVLMSLTNSIRLGVPRATPGIIGVALGTLMIAALSATGLGVILAASPTAYNVIKLAGMVFMLYLGWKRFNANPNFLRVVNYTGRKEQGAPEAGPLRLFGEGIVLQLSLLAAVRVSVAFLHTACLDHSFVLRLDGAQSRRALYDSEKLHLDQQNFRHRFLALRPVAAVLAGGRLIFLPFTTEH